VFASDFGVGQLVWSFLWFFLFVMWIVLVVSVIGDLFRDREASGVTKLLWTVFIVFLPYLGVLLYILLRGRGMAERNIKDAQAQEAAFRQYVQQAAGTGGPADQLAKLVELHEKGKLSDAEFASMKSKIIG
jgi:hypothetical protein